MGTIIIIPIMKDCGQEEKRAAEDETAGYH